MILPKNIQFLIDNIGYDDAVRVVNALYGRTISLSKGIRSAGLATFQQLAEIIGDEKARRLADLRDGEPLYIPRIAHPEQAIRDERNQRIRVAYDDLLRQGYSSRGAAFVLAGSYGLSDRQIFNIVNRSGKDPSTSNLELFAP